MRPNGRAAQRWRRVLHVASVSLMIAGGSAILGATAEASSAPTIEAESVSGLTEHGATLEAQIDPKGLETTYHFEIAKSGACLPVQTSYMPCSQVETGNLPSGTIIPSSQVLVVTQNLASAGMSLEPSTTYEYRVIASNSEGSVEGVVQSFTTPAASVSGSQPAAPTSPPSSATETKPSQAPAHPRAHRHRAHRRHRHKHRRRSSGRKHRRA